MRSTLCSLRSLWLTLLGGLEEWRVGIAGVFESDDPEVSTTRDRTRELLSKPFVVHTRWAVGEFDGAKQNPVEAVIRPTNSFPPQA